MASGVLVPELLTERLRLRGHCPEDFAEAAAMWGDTGVTRYIGGRPCSGEETWARMLRYAGHWAWLGFGYWVVEDVETGRFAGEVGLADFRREMEPGLEGAPELGWVLAPWAQGRGLATEAVKAVLRWRDTALAPGVTVCLIQPENSASFRVAEKCGFRERRRTVYHGGVTVVLER
jgi:RimJ/RimL family protein N-acetyltransferase